MVLMRRIRSRRSAALRRSIAGLSNNIRRSSLRGSVPAPSEPCIRESTLIGKPLRAGRRRPKSFRKILSCGPPHEREARGGQLLGRVRLGEPARALRHEEELLAARAEPLELRAQPIGGEL